MVYELIDKIYIIDIVYIMSDINGFSNEPIVIAITAKIEELNNKMDDYKLAHNEYFTKLGNNTTITVEQLIKMNTDIVVLRNDIFNLLKTITPYGIRNQTVIESNKQDLIDKITEMNKNYEALEEKLKEPVKFEEDYQESYLKYETNFYHYIAYFIVTLIVIIIFVFVLKSSDSSDMSDVMETLVIGLVLIIGGYYIYYHFYG
jgi:hypothetical protein